MRPGTLQKEKEEPFPREWRRTNIMTREVMVSKGTVVGLGEWMLELEEGGIVCWGQEQVLQRQFRFEGAHWA